MITSNFSLARFYHIFVECANAIDWLIRNFCCGVCMWREGRLKAKDCVRVVFITLPSSQSLAQLTTQLSKNARTAEGSYAAVQPREVQRPHMLILLL